MEGIETITSVQGAQGSSTGSQPPQTTLQQPETIGSTSSAALAEKFSNQKFNKNSKFTVQTVNGIDKIVFEQPVPKSMKMVSSMFLLTTYSLKNIPGLQ